MIKILIADDHQIFAQGLQKLLSENPEFQVIGLAEHGIQLLRLMEQQQADVVLLDLNMPMMNGIETCRKLIEQYPDCKVLVLTMDDDPEQVSRLIKEGASGYLLKHSTNTQVVEAINAVYVGRIYYSREVADLVVAGFKDKKRDQSKPDLTENELQIIKLIAEEFTTGEIAEKLYLSYYTVESYRKNILSKLKCRNIAGIVRYAIENGLVGK